MAVPGRNQNSVAYFDRITVSEVLQRRTSIKGGAHNYALGKLVNTYHVHTASMSPTLNKSSVLERIECGNAIEKSNGIMFDFYPALPHNYAQWANVDSLRN